MSGPRTGRFWLVTAAAVVGVLLASSLGAWQLSRAAQRNALHSAMLERSALPALDNRALAGVTRAADVVYRPVVLRGRWLPEHSVFLDNRQMRGLPGFYVVTPLALEDGAVVAVQRGWVQRNFTDRERLPSLPSATGTVEVRGRIAPPPAKLYEFSGAAAGAIRQNLDLGEFGAQTRLAVRSDLTVQQTGPASEGLLRDWPEASSGVEKNYGYAFQWFALGVLIAILYVWFQILAPRRRG